MYLDTRGIGHVLVTLKYPTYYRHSKHKLERPDFSLFPAQCSTCQGESKKGEPWESWEDDILISSRTGKNGKSFQTILALLPGRTTNACSHRYDVLKKSKKVESCLEGKRKYQRWSDSDLQRARNLKRRGLTWG